MREIKLSEKQAFWLWMLAIEQKDIPNGITGKLFDCFGGESSKLYTAKTTNDFIKLQDKD